VGHQCCEPYSQGLTEVQSSQGHWLFNGYNSGLRPAARLVLGQSLKLGLPIVNKSIGRKMLSQQIS